MSVSVSKSSSVSLSESKMSMLSEKSLSVSSMMCITSHMIEMIVKDICDRNGLDFFKEKEYLSNVHMSLNVDMKCESVPVENKKEIIREKNVARFKGKFPLPYNGKKIEGCCEGIKHNEGLLTQCRVAIKGESSLCKTCENQGKKNGTGKPTYGTITDRLKVGIMDYVAPSGDRPVKYQKVMKKYNLSKEDVLEEAKKACMDINEIHLNEEIMDEEERKRGRPKVEEKETTKAETSGKRGRPKKASKVVELGGDDLFSAIIENSNTSSEPNVAPNVAPNVVPNVAPIVEPNVEKVVEKCDEEASVESSTNDATEDVEEEEEEEEEEEADVVKKITFKDKQYLKSKKSGVIYDIETQDMIGEWNDETGEIDFYEEEEEEYEEE